jgi:3'-phosphoadenosine 5'-phosphosulfate sulfotransferase (PAPS reductase)/FAD synthetase
MPGEALLEQDLLRWRLSSTQRKVARSRAVIREFLGMVRRPYVAWSGGKDSLVCLALAVEECPGIDAIWSDDELEFPGVQEFIVGAAGELGASLLIAGGWAMHAGWFRPWTDQPFWRSPGHIQVWPGKRLEKWAPEHGWDGMVVGVRADESRQRRKHLARRGEIYQVSTGQVVCNPLARWTVDDVWAAIAGMRLPYSSVYDRMASIGVPRHRARVGPLPLAPGWVLARGWPDMLKQLTDRYGRRWPDERDEDVW